jgi:hypothetical protein
MKWLHPDQPDNSAKLGAGDGIGQDKSSDYAKVASRHVQTMQKVHAQGKTQQAPHH